jgi:putative transcriptional regulator
LQYYKIILNYYISVVFFFSGLFFLYTIMKKRLLKKLGARVKNIRKAKGITQAELAYSIDKDQSSIQRLEKGRINPSFYYLHEVAQGLDVPIKDLVDF